MLHGGGRLQPIAHLAGGVVPPPQVFSRWGGNLVHLLGMDHTQSERMGNGCMCMHAAWRKRQWQH